MEQKNGSGSSEHLNLQPDTGSFRGEDPLDYDEMLDYSYSYSSSSSSSLGVHDDEMDTAFSNYEENGSSSQRSNPDSPQDKLCMISASPLARSPKTSDLNTLYAYPKQSPAIQVMGHPPGYDPNRIPMSVFAPRQNNSEWGPASNESLFSIQMGYSFLTDSGMPGESNRLNDRLSYSCFATNVNKSSDLTSVSPGLLIVTETTAENEPKSASTTSAEKEELPETQNTSPIGSENKEKLQLSSPKSNVPAGKGAGLTDWPHNPASPPRHSDASGQSVSSFVFPVVAGASPKADAERSRPPPPRIAEETAMAEPPSKDPLTTPKAGGNQWFNCFSCCLICR